MITAVDVMKERLVVVGSFELETAFVAPSVADEGVAKMVYSVVSCQNAGGISFSFPSMLTW